MRNEQITNYFKAMEKQLKKIKEKEGRKVPFIRNFIDVGRINTLVRETLK